MQYSIKRLVLLSALATICSALLFVVVALWMPGTLLKPQDYSVDTINITDLAALKQFCALLAQTVSASQTLATTCVRLASVMSIILAILNAAVLFLVLNRRKSMW